MSALVPRRHIRRRAVWLIVAAMVVAAVVVVGLSRIYSSSAPSVPPGCTVTAADGSGVFTINLDQAQNAAIVAAAARKAHLPDHAVTVALATSLQESRLQNLPYGDRDSVGLFQQRPSQGWGTRAQLLDPIYAATAFYQKLTLVPGWQVMPVTEAAQSVQISGAPLAYAIWEPEARALATALTGESPGKFTCHLSGYDGPAPSGDALASAEKAELGSQLFDTPVDGTLAWEVASWAVAHAWRYHIAAVTVAGYQWTATSGHWVHNDRLSTAIPTTVHAVYGK